MKRYREPDAVRGVWMRLSILYVVVTEEMSRNGTRGGAKGPKGPKFIGVVGGC